MMASWAPQLGRSIAMLEVCVKVSQGLHPTWLLLLALHLWVPCLAPPTSPKFWSSTLMVCLCRHPGICRSQRGRQQGVKSLVHVGPEAYIHRLAAGRTWHVQSPPLHIKVWLSRRPPSSDFIAMIAFMLGGLHSHVQHAV